MKAWDGVGEAYAASYAALCAGTIDTLLELSGDAQSRTLLDVGSGTGELVARFASAGWDTTGCEPEPTMRTIAERAHPGIRFVVGALPELPFAGGSFDAITANFVLNHVADPRGAAREMARVGVSGAVLGATVWVESPSWFWRDVCASAGLIPAAGERLPPEKDFTRTAAGFGAMVGDAGWRQVRVVERTWTWRPTAATLWRSAEGGVASAGQFYRALDEHDRHLFRRAFQALCAELDDEGAVPLRHTAAVAVGRAA